MTGRHVCQLWRANIAQTYLDVFLRHPKRTVISFDCDWAWVKDMKCMFTVEMFFDRLDQDNRARVVFKEGEETAGFMRNPDEEYRAAYAQTKYGIWRNKIDMYTGVESNGTKQEGGNPDMAPYVVSIYGASLDSELPGLEYDVSKREISFEWESMLNAFCIEYAELERRDLSKANDMMPAAENTISTGGMTAIIDVMKSFSSMESTNLQALRRHRIRKHLLEKLGIDDPEYDLIDKVHEKEQLIRIRCATGVGEDDEDNISDGDVIGDDFANEFESDEDSAHEDQSEGEDDA